MKEGGGEPNTPSMLVDNDGNGGAAAANGTLPDEDDDDPLLDISSSGSVWGIGLPRETSLKLSWLVR